MSRCWAATLERVEGGGERVEKGVTARGRELACECVVVAAGVTPDVMLARSAGLELGESGGVACSSRLETTAAGVFAAGDVAEFDSPRLGRPVRIEHWDVAREQGRTAARNMVGRGVAHQVLPYFWSDLADWLSFEYVSDGGPPPGQPLMRGSLEEGAFSAFWLAEGGRMASALVVARPGDLATAQRMIAERSSPDRGKLVDAELSSA